ncbi:MAG: efflux RND transporter permease subunit [Bryobacteraceae bacterium]
MKLTQNSVQRRLATSAIMLALMVVGLYGFWRLPVDFLPNITCPMIKVHIWWRGATPEETDKNIADPIERQMATVDDLDYLERRPSRACIRCRPTSSMAPFSRSLKFLFWPVSWWTAREANSCRRWTTAASWSR